MQSHRDLSHFFHRQMEDTELYDTDSFSLSLGSSVTALTDFGSEPGSPYGSYSYPARQEKKDDNDEYVAELTRQMANSMLQDDDKLQQKWGGSGSPQSTLWSPFGFGSVSPIGPSREPSPPLVPATEKFEKMKARDDINPCLTSFASKQALIDDQIRSAQAKFRFIKEEREKEKEKRQQRNKDGGNRGRATTKQYEGKKSSGYGSGMKAVPLDGSGPIPGSGGTGVFLPRGIDTVMESRAKKGCKRVIIPARVVEALNLHYDKMGMPSKFTSDFPLQSDAFLMPMNNNNSSYYNDNSDRNNLLQSQMQRRKSYAAAVSANSHREPPAYLLPEWTY